MGIFYIGSHNSLSYIKPKAWYLHPFHFMAKCQQVDYKAQYEKHDVRIFDIRVWFSKTGTLQVRHGMDIFNITPDEVYTFLKYLNRKKDCYIRVWLEEDMFNRKSKQAPTAEAYFCRFCKAIEKKYKNIRFFGGKRKFDEKTLYTFSNQDIPQLIDRYSSTTSMFSTDNRFLRIVDDLWPWLYAKTHNRKNYRKYTQNHNGKWLLMDFVNIR